MIPRTAVNKLKLIADDLRVTSFESLLPDPAIRGTVRAHDPTRLHEDTCGGMSCDFDCVTRYEETCGINCIV